jgi:phosphoribosylformimino-5-aminoimidazole carboxamide ribotide isomerase/phosphoribosyl-ATP pyrophosphohydrolase/phosphoribosyl-AMP cyclohydrolase
MKTDKTLVAAGGITTMSEIETLSQAGIEVALGMAIYTGRLNINELRDKLS